MNTDTVAVGIVHLGDLESPGEYVLDSSSDGYYLNRIGNAGLIPLGDIPMDGTWEILSSGCDNEPVWFRYTPKHHLAHAAVDSTAYVVARTARFDGSVR